jgi:AraC family transcriptional activator of pobA
MSELKKYHLHKDDHSKLHFEINDAKKYVHKYIEHATKPHRHSFYQVIWFKKSGSHYIDYEIVNHLENTVLFITKNQVHHFCKNSPNDGVLFHFNENFINTHELSMMERFSVTIFNEIGVNHYQLPKKNIQKFSTISSYIFDEIVLNKNNYRDLVYHYFISLLLDIESIKSTDEQLEKPIASDLTLAIDFKKIVHEKIREFLSIQQYAALLNTNTSKLNTACKAHLFSTPANFIKAHKILEAKRMLSNQQTTVKQIAYTLGFEEASYFTKYFKKETGLKPKEFQQKHF